MSFDRPDRSSSLVRFFKGLYLDNRLFLLLAMLIVGFVLCFIFQGAFIVMQVVLGATVVVLCIDAYSLYRLQDGITGYRIIPDRLSNGDENRVTIVVKNNYTFGVKITIVEEVPFQFQKRDLVFVTQLVAHQERTLHYNLRPTRRGTYIFGNINVFAAGVFSLVSRRYILPQSKPVPVYPSFLEMHKYELLASSHRLTEYGIKQIRRIGHATEFEHIKHYVMGDDPRTINYKATARSNQLMVNTYTEERSQPIYCLIDKGRTMKMPFDELTLLDYAINSALMVSSIAINKGDKAGLITFSNKLDDTLIADSRQLQKQKIMQLLYAQETDFKDSNYAELFVTIRRRITQRSLLVLFTNFETVNGLRRQLKYLRLMAKEHLVLVAFFINTEFDEILDTSADTEDTEQLFRKATAEKLSNDKQLIVKELNRNGIQTILSTPKDLTINSINKYLEMKARGLI